MAHCKLTPLAMEPCGKRLVDERRDDLLAWPEHPTMPPCPGPLDAHRATIMDPAGFATPKTSQGWSDGIRCFGLSRRWFGIAALRWRHGCCLRGVATCRGLRGLRFDLSKRWFGIAFSGVATCCGLWGAMLWSQRAVVWHCPASLPPLLLPQWSRYLLWP